MEAHERESAVLRIAECKSKEKELATLRRDLTAQLAEFYLGLKPSAKETFNSCTMSISVPKTYKVKKGADPYQLKGQVNGDVLAEVFKTSYKVDGKAFNLLAKSTPALLEVVEIKEGAPQITVEVDS
jgi:hypothetical protein